MALHDDGFQVCEGDEVVVAVTNNFSDGSSTSIHWHGQHVYRQPHFDGVGLVTQCPIMYRETFT
jgi:FtsP/CotA-like multicopper oxidase with cupredoxin domain